MGDLVMFFDLLKEPFLVGILFIPSLVIVLSYFITRLFKCLPVAPLFIGILCSFVDSIFFDKKMLLLVVVYIFISYGTSHVTAKQLRYLGGKHGVLTPILSVVLLTMFVMNYFFTIGL